MHITQTTAVSKPGKARNLVDFKTPALAGRTPLFTIAYRVPRPEEFDQTWAMVRQRTFELGHPDERGWSTEESRRYSATFFVDHPLRYNFPNKPREAAHIYTGDIQNGGVGRRLTQQLLQPEDDIFAATYVAPTLYELGFRPGDIIKEVDPDVSSLISIEARLWAKQEGVKLQISKEELGYIPYTDLFRKLDENGLIPCNSLVTSPLLHLMGVDYHAPEITVIMGDHLFSPNYPLYGQFLCMQHRAEVELLYRIEYGCINFPVFRKYYNDNPIGGFRTGLVPPIKETGCAKMLNRNPSSLASYNLWHLGKEPNPKTGAQGFLNLRLLLQINPEFRYPGNKTLFGQNQVMMPAVENVNIDRMLSTGTLSTLSTKKHEIETVLV